MATPDRHWPPRLRRALRERLAVRGLAIPPGLVISYGPKPGAGTMREPWIVVSHRPGRTETWSVQETLLPFRGEDDIDAATDLAERHALGMLRRDARADALEAGGHALRCPPYHMVEAAPLVALAMALVEAGRAGLDGKVHIENGQLQMRSTLLATPIGRIEVQSARLLSIPSPKAWPHTVLAGLRGKPLSHAVSLPACGRRDVDEAVSRLRIEHAEGAPGRIAVVVHAAPVLPLSERDRGDDRSWLGMEPVPVG